MSARQPVGLEIEALREDWLDTLEGDSNDAEHDASMEYIVALEELLGIEPVI